LKEAILEHRQGAVIGCGLVHRQPNEPLDHQVIIDQFLHLAFRHTVKIGDEQHLEDLGRVVGWTPTDASPTIGPDKLLGDGLPVKQVLQGDQEVILGHDPVVDQTPKEGTLASVLKPRS